MKGSKMLIRQLFDHQTYTYTYLLADTNTREALLIDPIIDHLDSYIRLLTELNLELKMAIDTHVHADHVTALGKLREVTQCKTYLGVENEVQCSDSALSDNQILKIGKYELQVIYTPGHTDNSFASIWIQAIIDIYFLEILYSFAVLAEQIFKMEIH